MATAVQAREWAHSALRGIGDSLYTPFSGADGDDIDWDAYRTLVRYCVADLEHPLLWVTSGLAEFWSLTIDERKRLLAAFRVSGDKAYLREAATNFPNDPAVQFEDVGGAAYLGWLSWKILLGVGLMIALGGYITSCLAMEDKPVALQHLLRHTRSAIGVAALPRGGAVESVHAGSVAVVDRLGRQPFPSTHGVVGDEADRRIGEHLLGQRLRAFT